MEFFTIGVYNSNEKEFFKKLLDNYIDTFCDIRQRRGVRGKKYAFANSIYLQKKLSECEIKYGYIVNLSPSTEIRNIQKEKDNFTGVKKKKRQKLSQDFVEKYIHEVINKFDFDEFISQLEYANSNRIVLFCVEERPEACHRSIVTDELHKRYNFSISHL